MVRFHLDEIGLTAAALKAIAPSVAPHNEAVWSNRYVRMAMKAQSQCRMTLESLATLKRLALALATSPPRVRHSKVVGAVLPLRPLMTGCLVLGATAPLCMRMDSGLVVSFPSV